VVAVAVVTVVVAGGASAETLTLAECMQMAMESNHGYRATVADAEQSRGNAVGSWANVLPRVSGSLSKDQTTSNDVPIIVDGTFLGTSAQTSTFFSANAAVSANLLDLSSYYSFRQSRTSWASTRRGLSAAAQAVAIEVATQFFDVVRKRRTVSLREENLTLSRDQLRRTQALFDLGAAPKADVLDSRVSASQSERDLISAQNDYQIALGRLNLALGRSTDAALEVEYDPVGVPLDLPSVTVATEAAQDRRPDMRQAELALRAAELGKRSAWLGLFPSLTGSLSWRRTTNDRLKSWDFDNPKEEASWGYRLALEVPIFDGLVTKGQRIRAAGSYQSSLATLAQKESEVRLEVREALLNIEAARKSLEVSDDEIEAAREQLRLREAMYDQGAATILELIQARVNLTDAEVSAVTTETGLQLAWYEYLRASGILLYEAVEE
jgi:outer membrane protein